MNMKYNTNGKDKNYKIRKITNNRELLHVHNIAWRNRIIQ